MQAAYLGSRSRIRTSFLTAPAASKRSPARTRPRLFKDLALLAQLPHLAPQPGEILPLRGREPVGALAGITLGLVNPVGDRLAGRLNLLGDAVDGAAAAGQLDDTPLVLRRVRGACLAHCGLLAC